MKGAARAVLLLCALSVIGQACTHAQSPIVTLPNSSWRPGDPGHLAAAEGVVEGSARDGCVWLLARDGTRVPIVWPAGFYARFRPLRIYDSSGNVVATQGQLIQVGGGDESAVRERCMLGRQDAFIIESSVTAIGP